MEGSHIIIGSRGDIIEHVKAPSQTSFSKRQYLETLSRFSVDIKTIYEFEKILNRVEELNKVEKDNIELVEENIKLKNLLSSSALELQKFKTEGIISKIKKILS